MAKSHRCPIEVVTPKVWAGGGGGPEIYWEIADPLGSGLLLIGENGLRAREFSFTPFGEPRSAVGGATSLRNSYAGHRYDEASGLVYMNARWYEPGSGRFMSVDPVLRTGAPQSHNAYSYVENNPIAANDPTGMCLRCFTDLWAETGWSTDIVTTTYLSNGPNKPLTQIAQTTVTVTNDGGVVTIGGDQWTGYGPAPIPTSRAMSQRDGYQTGERIGPNERTITWHPGGGSKLAGGPAVAGGAAIAFGGELGPPGILFWVLGGILLGGAILYSFVVNPDGVVVPVGPDETVTSSPDGKWIQVRSPNGIPTGTRLDDGHKPNTHPDSRAQKPHGHIPGRTNPDGTPWLPSGGK